MDRSKRLITYQTYPVIAAVLVFAVALLYAPPQLHAQTTRDKLTATYLFRLAENIQWPNAAGIERYLIHLVDDSKRVARELQTIAKNRRLHGKPFQVTRSAGTEVPAGTHLVYLAKDMAADYPAVLKQTEGRNILLISDNVPDKRNIMINLFETPDKQVRFEINKANIINQNLGINPDIILLGGTEIDVARLYREVQVSLREQDAKLAALDDRRRALEALVEQEKQEAAGLEQALTEQKARLAEQETRIKAQQTAIDEQQQAVLREQQRLKEAIAKTKVQETIIASQQEQIDEEHSRYEALISQSEKQQALIEQQKTLMESERQNYAALTESVRQREIALEEQAKQIEARSTILAEQDQKIERQERTILTQEEVLAQQTDIITGQRNFLYAMVVVVLLVSSMALMIFRSYRLKKISNARLLEQQELVKKGAAELQQANQKLKELDKLKSMFIASMSHELRTPLNSIIGFSGMTLQELSGELNEEQKDNLTRVHNSGKHLLQLISDVIDISKIEAGRAEIFPEEFSLHALINEAVETVKPQLQEKSLTLEMTLDEDVAMHTDRKRLLQCLLNFLSNAVKYTETGSVSVVAGANEGIVELSVTDTGIGIPQEEMPKLFEAFERLPSHLRVKAGGTGLGLYLTKKMVTDLLQGTVAAASRDRQGSTFTLRIPQEIHPQQEGTEDNTGGFADEDSADH